MQLFNLFFTHNTMKNLFKKGNSRLFCHFSPAPGKIQGHLGSTPTEWVSVNSERASSSRFIVFAKKGFSNTRNRLVPEEHLRIKLPIWTVSQLIRPSILSYRGRDFRHLRFSVMWFREFLEWLLRTRTEECTRGTRGFPYCILRRG